MRRVFLNMFMTFGSKILLQTELKCLQMILFYATWTHFSLMSIAICLTIFCVN